MVVLAVTRQTEVGVDVECITRDTMCADVAERYFSPREVEELCSLLRNERTQRFYDLWTLKEAYIKARGMGLSLPLDGFSFQFPAPDSIDIAFGPEIRDEAANWNFWLFRPGDQHHVALAVKSASPEEQFHVSIREFIPPSTYRGAGWPCVRSSAKSACVAAVEDIASVNRTAAASGGRSCTTTTPTSSAAER
jgi:4'-phosphopantetheinyl transferase